MTTQLAKKPALEPPARVRAVAASRLGMTLAAYDQRLAAGEKRCTGCKEWHPRAAFGKDSARSDGLQTSCRPSRARLPRPAPRICACCGQVREAYSTDWCRSCFDRWDQAGRPADGPPPAPSPAEITAARREHMNHARQVQSDASKGRFEDYEFLLSVGEHDRDALARRLGVRPSTVDLYETRLRRQRRERVSA